MIKIDKTRVFNFEGAIRGMRNPLNSWDKSDSLLCGNINNPDLVVGENDLSLMQKLIKAGPEHRKFMRQILLSTDITAPLYWWKEFDTYKIGTVANSCSTMHKIAAKEFTLGDFSHEHVDGELVAVHTHHEEYATWDVLKLVVDCLNWNRRNYLETKDKKYWWQIIQLLPSSYNQRRTWTGNYENLFSMYCQRKNHKLDEWHDFCHWIESLPYANELIIGGKESQRE